MVVSPQIFEPDWGQNPVFTGTLNCVIGARSVSRCSVLANFQTNGGRAEEQRFRKREERR